MLSKLKTLKMSVSVAHGKGKVTASWLSAATDITAAKVRAGVLLSPQQSRSLAPQSPANLEPRHTHTHTTSLGSQSDGMLAKFSFITSSSKRPVGYSFRCSREQRFRKVEPRQNREISGGRKNITHQTPLPVHCMATQNYQHGKSNNKHILTCILIKYLQPLKQPILSFQT